MSQSEMLDNALMRAADQTTANGMTAEGIKLLETIYKRNPQDPQAAIRYARGLRELNEIAKASVVLEPFAKDVNAPAALRLEYAAIQLEAGRYEIAENTAREVVKQDATSGFAYHLLGTALDAQGLHPAAEAAFRSALENWTGDPVPVMNNLALSLTAQQKLDEAADILVKAKEIDPTRMEIERNLRIVNALRETVAYQGGH
jgi:Flp pilus assembly protein TadD